LMGHYVSIRAALRHTTVLRGENIEGGSAIEDVTPATLRIRAL